MNRYISRRDYLKKDNSNVGYALYVQDNIKKDDYARLNTGEIVRIIGIRENELDKKAIYFNIYNEDWCNSAAVENFSDDITDLIEVGDVIEVYFPFRNTIRKIYVDEYFEDSMILNGIINGNVILKTILTKELYNANCYTVERKK